MQKSSSAGEDFLHFILVIFISIILAILPTANYQQLGNFFLSSEVFAIIIQYNFTSVNI
jgi:hypothetical protein